MDLLIQEYTANVFLMGLAIYREAAGEPHEGKVAVGFTIMDRANHPKWWGSDPYSVITKPKQYSSMTYLGDPMTIVFPPLSDRTFQTCLDIAQKIYNKEIANPVPGADSYYSTTMKAPPKWADEKKFLKQIGKHRFYNLGGEPAEEAA